MDLDIQWLGRLTFDDALALQEARVSAIRSGSAGPQLLLLEHEPVFTIGRTRDQSSLLNASRLPHPLREINRGGQATYHGPGQLVGYPILDLHQHGRDLHRHLRFIENVLIELLATFNIPAERRESLTGVWVGTRKIASIGVGVRHWITMHGFALNVAARLEAFNAIIPCGISGVEMTSIETETGANPGVEPVARRAGEILRAALQSLG
jgi:lipoyl(octanoyl) transferase